MSTQLQDASEARKAKLAALRARKRAHEGGEGDANGQTSQHDGQMEEDGGGDEEGGPRPAKRREFKFRNYDPATGQARKHGTGSAAPARMDESEEGTADGVRGEDTVEKQVEGMAESVIAQDAILRSQELDLTNIQPKKANWDLKAHLDKKLARLRPKTEAAIATLIRKRLQGQKGGNEAAAVVAAAPQTVGADPESDIDEED